MDASHGLGTHARLFGRVKAPANPWERHPDSEPARKAARHHLKRSPLSLVPYDGSRVLETPVDALRVSRKGWAALGGPITNGDHVIESLAHEPAQVFRKQILGRDTEPGTEVHPEPSDAPQVRDSSPR